jgi:hypothetical protein
VRTRDLRRFDLQHQARDILLGNDGAALVARELGAIVFDDLADTAATLGLDIGVREERDGHALILLKAAPVQCWMIGKEKKCSDPALSVKALPTPAFACALGRATAGVDNAPYKDH